MLHLALLNIWATNNTVPLIIVLMPHPFWRDPTSSDIFLLPPAISGNKDWGKYRASCGADNILGVLGMPTSPYNPRSHGLSWPLIPAATRAPLRIKSLRLTLPWRLLATPRL